MRVALNLMEKRNRLLENTARCLSLLLAFVIPILAFYYFVVNPSATIGTLTPYDTSSLIIYLHWFVSPLIWFPFFLLFPSKFNLVRIPLIAYGTTWLFVPITVIVIDIFNIPTYPSIYGIIL